MWKNNKDKNIRMNKKVEKNKQNDLNNKFFSLLKKGKNFSIVFPLWKIE